MVSEEAVILTVPSSDFSTNSNPLESEGLIFDSDFEKRTRSYHLSLWEVSRPRPRGFVFFYIHQKLIA